MVALVVQTRALGDYYLKITPISGGLYSEGMLGSYTNSNPIFATNDVDSSVSKLLFSSLLTYSQENQLVGDLASDWSVDAEGTTYTINLRQDVEWHDGEGFDADDVLFTYKSIQDPDARSPYFSSWQGIEIQAVDKYTITMKLPNVLASFPYSLTTGILPEHILSDLDADELRGDLFNTVLPVGTGPFEWSDVEVRGDTAEDREQRIALRASDKYYDGRPNISEFIIRAFLDEQTLADAYSKGELNAVAGALSISLDGGSTNEINIPLTGGVMVFLNNSSEAFKDKKVRQAVTMATNTNEIIAAQERSTVGIDGPLLPEHIGYRKNVTQLGFNIAKANKILDEAGWKLNKETGVREKSGKSLVININTLSNSEYASVATMLQKQWKVAGIDVNISSLAQRELQSVIEDRSYDALMYGIVMGLDPDQFAYWHSTQADPRSQRRLNFSEYKSSKADSALEAGRTRTDPKLRAAKYLPFLQTWRDDSPAIALYRPRYIYTTHNKLYNFEPIGINSPTDRFANVENWMIRTKKTTQ